VPVMISAMQDMQSKISQLENKMSSEAQQK
jgi:hypothetical protein